MPEDIQVSLFFGLTIAGAILSVWLMTLILHNQFILLDPPFIRHGRRVALAIMAFGMLWGAKYGYEHRWQPWAPDLLLLGGIDLYLAIAIFSVYWRTHLHEMTNKKSPA